jgi:erythrocyte band 7 integral membrane protein
LQEVLDDVTHDWGVEVERVEVKDISLPKQMQRIMAVEAEASREYKASIIYADGELKSSDALKCAADILKDSPLAVQLRYIHALSSITAKNESTIMFPIPIDMSSIYNYTYLPRGESKEESAI